MKSSIEQFEPDIAAGISAESKAAWQFSLRSLLVLTTIVSVCMAIGVHFAGFLFAVLIVGLIQATTLLSADWLIRPANRRALAFVTAGSWILMGSALLIVGAGHLVGVIGEGNASTPSMLGLGLVVASVFCYYVASRRWLRLTYKHGAARQIPNARMR